MTTRKILFQKPSGFFENFDRRPGSDKKSMHYCPGCGHGIVHKLLAEAVADMDLQKNTVLMAPVGCSVLIYAYLGMNSISVPHGRAPAVATGILRSNPHSLAISYQGDGDLAAIGFNEFLQAANRGETMAVIFVNNGIYGMTGGQMAPTTLPGQKTLTSPYGRDPVNDGMPMKVCEIVATMDAPVFVARVASTTPKRIREARSAIRKALTYMQERKGFSLVEILSACPTNMKMDTPQCDQWVEERMGAYFPMKVFKDVGAERTSISRPVPIFDPAKVVEAVRDGLDDGVSTLMPVPPLSREVSFRFAGFGGQGVLSMGLLIAKAAHAHGLTTTWLPSYGPEMRGGTANCSVMVSTEEIGSPFADEPDFLVAFTQPSAEKFGPRLRPGGIMLYDSSTMSAPPRLEVKEARSFPIPASDIANDLGNVRCANAVMLGALTEFMAFLSMNSLRLAAETTFEGKRKVIDLNIAAMDAGAAAARSAKDMP